MKSNVFSIKYLPMDIGRGVYLLLKLFYRPIFFDENGRRIKSGINGGAIIAANHTGFGDPFSLGVSFSCRRVFFLAAEAVMKNKLLSALLRGMGCIKIDRNVSDIEAVKRCIGVLKDGKLLVVFPQGSIDRTEDVKSLKSGSVLMSLQAGVPIIPIFSLPQKNIFRRKILIIGSAVDCKEHISKKIPSVKDMDKISEIIRVKMCELQVVYERIAGDEHKR